MKWLCWIVVAAFTVIALALTQGCSASTRAGTATVVLAEGRIVRDLWQTNRDVYTHETDMLRGRMQGSDYDRAVAPIDSEFRRRSRALQVLSTAIYAQAHINDATNTDSMADRLQAALAVLSQLREAIEILHDGSQIPPIPIPQAIWDVEHTLVAFTGGSQ